MKRLVLSKEVANAISHLQGNFNYTFQDFMQVKSAGGWNKEEGTFSLNNLDIETLAIALINGYEVEKEPEEYMLEYFNSYDSNEDYDKGIQEGVLRALDIFGIEVEGINKG